MTIGSKKEPFFLFVGDLFFFVLSLWLMLFVRYGEFPNKAVFYDHLWPFSILFVVWFAVFFIAGLYEKHTIILRSKLPAVIFYSQVVNSLLAVLFFYFIPYFGITPKTNLFIYLVISFILILFWRNKGQAFFGIRKRENALLIGSGEEMKELRLEVNNNPRYNFHFVSSVDLDNIENMDFKEEILKNIYSENIRVVAIDLKNEKVEPILPSLYNLIFSRIKFIDMYKVYEDIFDRIPLSLVKYNWFLENISTSSKITYDFLKRGMDIVISLPLAILSLVVYPFVFIAIKLEDGGPIFIVQERIGKDNHTMHILKFRSMDKSEDGVWVGETQNNITKTGSFLRQTRIDELPQLWNVLRGDLSLIGPRPDIHDLGVRLAKEIPYYNIRSIIKPGLSGWAQIKQEKPPHSVEETKLRLAYDFYYIKNRSFVLDVKIALKTLKTLASRVGR